MSVYFSSVCWISRRQQQRLSYSVILGCEQGPQRLVKLPAAISTLPTYRALPRSTHWRGHRLRAHEVLVDLVPLCLLILHAVIKVLVFLRGVTGRQIQATPQARDPSKTFRIKDESTMHSPPPILQCVPLNSRADPCSLILWNRSVSLRPQDRSVYPQSLGQIPVPQTMEQIHDSAPVSTVSHKLHPSGPNTHSIWSERPL